MRIIQINAVCGQGSTGRICVSLSEASQKECAENAVFYSSKSKDYPFAYKYATERQLVCESLKSHIFGNYGFTSKRITKRLIEKIKEYSPDIVHLHNLHSHGCNLELLLDFLNENRIKVVWTFHDCWAFTGYCPHYAMIGCNQWKKECVSCPQYKSYSFFRDRSNTLFLRKKRLSENLDLTIVTPSEWLANEVKQSFLKNKPITVINNGIDLSVFKPRKGSFREKHNIPSNKKIVLGVAFNWNEKKGLDVFIKLSEKLDSDKYQIVLVGTNTKVDEMLPPSVITINKTHDQVELASIYSEADIFVNPTREENFPTVNIESLACGTPVITFKTGGSPEIIDETCGVAVDSNDVDKLYSEIVRCCENNVFTEAACINRAMKYNQEDKIKEYIDLYRRLYDRAPKE